MVETTIKPQEYTPDPDVSAALKGSLSTMPEGLRDPYEKAFEAQRKNQFDMLERERVQKANLAQAKAGASGGLAAGMQRQYDQFNKMEAPPKLNVTPETREGLIGMASLLPIAGLILGAGGMSSGVNAMKALTGIINGHAEGNKERIEFEKQKYDAAMKECDVIVETLPVALGSAKDFAVKFKGAERPVDHLEKAKTAGFAPGKPQESGIRIWTRPE